MSDFSNIAYIARKIDTTTDINAKLRAAKRLKLLIDSALMSLRIQAKKEERT